MLRRTSLMVDKAHQNPTLPLLVAGLLAVAMLVRLPLMDQGLWYDEMYTAQQFLAHPWRHILTTYIPNNHLLFTLLAKAVHDLQLGLELPTAIRLVSLLAGLAAVLILAWPMLKVSRREGCMLGLLAALHPWLASFSAWARGYALLLMLALLATGLLTRRGPWVLYALVIAAALCTHPIAVAIPIGHAAALWFGDRRDIRRWFLAAGAGGLLAGLLHLPMLAGAQLYWQTLPPARTAWLPFIASAFRHAQAGWDAPGIATLLLPILICTAGTAFAVRVAPLRPWVITFAVASAFAFLAALLARSSAEARAVPWLIPLYILGLFGACDWAAHQLAGRLKRKWLAQAVWVLPLATLAAQTIALMRLPAQPMDEALAFVQEMRAPGQPVIGLYTAASEARAFYGGIDAVAMALSSDSEREVPTLPAVEKALGGRPLLIVFYDELLARDAAELRKYVQDRYRLLRRFPGRISPVDVYERRP